MKFYQQFLPYVVAICSTAIALLLTFSLEPFLLRTIGAFFFIAIMVTAWYGGRQTGSVAIILSTIAINYWFIPPRYQFWSKRPEDVLQLALFLLVALTLNLLTSNFRDSKKKIERLSKQLAQENAQQLRMALAAAEMGMWDWNVVTGAINWSPEHEQLFGLSPGTFDGRYETFDACLYPDDREALNQAVERSIKEQVPYQHEYRVVWADGSIHWIEGRGQAFYNEAGQPVSMTGTVMAIDQRKQAEAALQEREAILQLFAQYAPAGIAMFDKDMRYVIASQRWVEEYNLESIESLINRSHYEIFPEIPERWRQIHQRCLAGAIERCDEDFFVRADGVQQWICWEVHPWHTATGEIGGIIIFAVDITKYKQVETALRETQIQLQQQLAQIEAIYQSAPIGLSVLDTELRFVRINQRLAEINGLSVEAHLNHTIYEIVPNLADATEQLLRPILETGKPLLNVEIIGETPAQPGVQRIWLESFLPLKDGDQIIGISTVCEEITERKQAEEALRQSEERYRTLFESIDEGFCVIEMLFDQNNTPYDYRFLEINPTFEKQTGLQEAVGKTARQLMPNLEAHWFEIYGQVALTGEPLRFEHGSEAMNRWFDVYALRVGQQSNRKVAIIFQDISERKQAERAATQLNAELEQRVADRTAELIEVNERLLQTLTALQQSEERRRLALDLTHIGFWDLHLLSGKNIWNDNLFTLLGLAPYDIDSSYELWRSHVHPDDIGWVEQRFLESMENHTDYAAEYRVVHPDGSVHWLMGRGKAIYDESGQPLRSLGVLLDISDRKRTEEAFRQSEAKFRSLSESSPVGIFMTDIQGECTYTNPCYQAICNCTFDEALGAGWVQFIHPEEREDVTAGWLKAVSAGQAFSGEIRYVHKDGCIRFGRVQSAPIFSVLGDLAGYVGTVEDVTDSRAVEVMKNEFISIVSHELRTPLASIRGSLGLLAAGVFKNKPESAQKMLDIATHDTERLVRLVNDILDLERLDSHKVNLVKQWCDASTLMQQSVETVQSLAVASQIRLSVTPASVQVWLDSDRILQTLVNLLSNAIKFSPPETTVTLSVIDQADRVLFQVKDQGRGIPDDKLDKVFGRFQQVDASDSRQKGGTGLGLAICKSIVQQHGGKIWVESVLQKGSSFYFTLPKFLD